MNYKPYRKTIAAIVGVAAVMFGPDYFPDQEAMVQAIMAVLAVVAVYQAKNEEA